MPKKIQLGTTNFAEVITSDALWADKSLFIKEIIDDANKVTLITRPRRWGKTLNMSMLHHFLADEVAYEKTQGLFDNLLIAKADDGHYLTHQGKYPVISISFKDVKEKSFKGVLNSLTFLIQELFSVHKKTLLKSDRLDEDDKEIFTKYLKGKGNKQELEKAIKILSELLHKHYNKKVYILIDEYDTPLNAAYKTSYFEDLTYFMKNMFSAALKDNNHLKKGVMTGILRISKDSMLSGLNHLKPFTVLSDKYSPYFGFTEEELDPLFKEQGLEKDETKVKEWYNGYSIGGLTLYNPWSIMNSLSENGGLKPYWVNTADDSLLKEVLQEANAEIKAKFQLLLEGKAIEGLISETIRFDNLKNNETGVWSLLLYAGYLTATSMSQDNILMKCKLAIPNQEVFALYKTYFIEWLGQPSKVLELKSLLQNLLAGNIHKFASDIGDFLTAVASYRDYAMQPEAFYHGFMLALTASLIDLYYIDSNKESGLGLPDLLFIPKDKKETQAIILEFKHVHAKDNADKIAKNALTQIDEQDYTAKIKPYDYIETVLKVGLAFNGKVVHYQFKVDPIEKLFDTSLLVNSSLEKSPGSSLIFDDEFTPEKKRVGKRKWNVVIDSPFSAENAEKSTPKSDTSEEAEPSRKKMKSTSSFFRQLSSFNKADEKDSDEEKTNSPSSTSGY